jgi:hypothetical protein
MFVLFSFLSGSIFILQNAGSCRIASPDCVSVCIVSSVTFCGKNY